jgi:5'-nucleotidase
MRFHYDLSRPTFDAVTQIELGDLTLGYHSRDISEGSPNLNSVAGILYCGLMLVSLSRKAGVSFVPKRRDGTPLKSRAEALPERPQGGPYLLAPKGTIDKD